MTDNKTKITEANRAAILKCEKCRYVRKIDYTNLKIYCNSPYCKNKEEKRLES